MTNIYVYAIQKELYGAKIAEVITKAIARGYVTDDILKQAVKDEQITKDQYSRATGNVLP